MKTKALALILFAGILTACTHTEETSDLFVGDQIIEDLNWRYTAKAYDQTKRISEEDLDTIQEVLRLSP